MDGFACIGEEIDLFYLPRWQSEWWWPLFLTWLCIWLWVPDTLQVHTHINTGRKKKKTWQMTHPSAICAHFYSFWLLQRNQRSSMWAYTSTASAPCHPLIWWVMALSRTSPPSTHKHICPLPDISIIRHECCHSSRCILEAMWAATAVCVVAEAKKDRCGRCFVRALWISLN